MQLIFPSTPPPGPPWSLVNHQIRFQVVPVDRRGQSHKGAGKCVLSWTLPFCVCLRPALWGCDCAPVLLVAASKSCNNNKKSKAYKHLQPIFPGKYEEIMMWLSIFFFPVLWSVEAGAAGYSTGTACKAQTNTTPAAKRKRNGTISGKQQKAAPAIDTSNLLLPSSVRNSVFCWSGIEV